MAGVECITLDVDSGDEAPQRLNITVNNADSGFIRCNFCVDPGWLLADNDPIDHRQRMHARSLFYCDACGSDERGAKGFETIAEVSNHVIKENGLNPTDTKNIHDLIRIPGKPELLKIFRCTFCPGKGLEFVALSEEMFLEHVRNRHGLKAPRMHPDKMGRECRVCGEGLTTDAELTRHVTRKHLENGEENRLPFVGFGPRDVITQDISDSNEFENGRDEVRVSDRAGLSGIAKKSRTLNSDWIKKKGKGKRRSRSSSRDVITQDISDSNEFEKGRDEVRVSGRAGLSGIAKKSRSMNSDWIKKKGKGKRKGKDAERRSRSSSRDVITQDISDSNEFENGRDEVRVSDRAIAKKSRSLNSDWFKKNGKGKRKGREAERRSRSSSSNGSGDRGQGKRKRKRAARHSQSSSNDASASLRRKGEIKRNRKGTQRWSQSSSSDDSFDREREIKKRKDKIRSRSLSTNGSQDKKKGKRRSRSSSSDGSVGRGKRKRMSRHASKDDKTWLDETVLFLTKTVTKKRKSGHVSKDDRKWLAETDMFLSKIFEKKGKSEKENEKDVDMKNKQELLIKSGPKSKEKDANKHNSADIEVLYHHNASPKLLKCDICSEDGIWDMPKHLSRFHQDMTFLCTLCEEVFINIETAGSHLENNHDRTGSGKSFLKTGHIQSPPCLLSVICNFCQPTKQIFASSPDIFMYEIFDHMDQHEDQHKGVEKRINLGVDYCCRICTGSLWKDLKSLEDHVNNQHKKVETEDAREKRSRSSGTWKDEDKGFVIREVRWRTRFGDHGRNEGSVAKKKSRRGGWKDEGNKGKYGDEKI